MQEMIVLQTDTQSQQAAPDIRVYRPTQEKEPLPQTDRQDAFDKEQEFDFSSYLQPSPKEEEKEPDYTAVEEDTVRKAPLPDRVQKKRLPIKLVLMAVILGAFVWCYPKICPTLDRIMVKLVELSAVTQIQTKTQDASDLSFPQESGAQTSDEIKAEQSEAEQSVKSESESKKEAELDTQSSQEETTSAIVGTANNTNGEGTVKVQTFSAVAGGIYIPLQHGLIKNVTEVDNAVLEKAVKKDVAFTLSDTAAPQVLIMHTHTTESYLSKDSDSFDTDASFRSTDLTQNMARVGDAVASALEAAGIGVLHDTTLHDHPAYSGSYARSAKTVKAYLEEYPSIKIVLDLHRDAIGSKDTITAPTATVDGKKAAQIMIISGCDDGTMDMPNYLDNLAFAAALQNKLEQLYPTLTRPVLFDYRKYNQDLTTGSLLIEIGSNANTLEQAVYSGALLGNALASFCKSQIAAT